MKIFFLFSLFTVTVLSQTQTPTTFTFPPGEDGARAVLESSPRHGEWIDIPYNDKTQLRSWIVYPEIKDKAPVIIIIHEIFGLSDWIRSVADQLAKDGFIAVAPDFISGYGPNGGGTESVTSRDSVVRLIRALSAEETYARLNAVHSFGKKIPSGTGKIATIGFCWGGARSFGYACVQKDLKAAVVYYGSSPDSVQLSTLNAPVLGLYGADDARVNTSIEPASVEIKRSGKQYDYELFEGAGHGFLRQQSARDGANARAAERAWKRTIEFLKKHL